jgi:hypothetical protein
LGPGSQPRSGWVPPPGTKVTIPQELRDQGYLSRGQLGQRLFRQRFKSRQLTHFTEIDVSGLNVIQPDVLKYPATFLIPGETGLDLTAYPGIVGPTALPRGVMTER